MFSVLKKRKENKDTVLFSVSCFPVQMLKDSQIKIYLRSKPTKDKNLLSEENITIK